MKSDAKVAVVHSVQQPRQTLPMIAAGSLLPRGRFAGRSRLSACLTRAGRPRRLRLTVREVEAARSLHP
jgi:hypothetical protein